MAITYVQSAQNAVSGSTTCVLAFTSNNTAGNTLVLAAGVWKSGGAFTQPSINDTAGNVWVKVNAGNKVTSQAYIFACYNCAAGANTVTLTASASCDIDMAIHEYSGLATVSPLDQSISSLISGSTVSFTTHYANELLFSVGYDQSQAGDTFTASAGWTGRQQTSNPDGECLKTFDQIVSATGTYSNTLSINQSSNQFSILMCSFADTPVSTQTIRTAAGGAVATSAAVSITNTSANQLFLAVGMWNSGGLGTLAVSDSKGNTWTLLGTTPLASPATRGFSQCYVYYCVSCAGGSNTITATSTVSSHITLGVAEFHSTLHGPTFSGTSATTGTGSTTSGTVTTDGTAPLFGFVFDQTEATQVFAPFQTGVGWRQRDNFSSTPITGTSLSLFEQLPGAGTFALATTNTGISFGIHEGIVALSTTATVVQPFLIIAT